jgi:tetratricopeptide (TPR) repeat protein
MRKGFVFVIVILILGGWSCSKPQKQDLQVLVDPTDSVVISNLISQSEITFAENIKTTEAFDEFLKDAEKVALRGNHKYQLSLIYNTIGKRYRNRSLYIEALNFHKKALELAHEIQDVQLLAECNNQVGVVYRRMDENSLALDLHLKAMKFAEEANDSFNISVSLNGIGNVNLSMGRYLAAVEYFKKSISISGKMNNVMGLAINTNNIGEAYLLSGKPDSALYYFYTSLEYNSSINSRLGQSICYNSIGDTYIAKGEPQIALEYLMKALRNNQEIGDLIYVAVSLTRVGETYLSLGDYRTALSYLEDGFKLSKKIGSKYQAEDASFFIAQVHEKLGHYKEALEYYKLRSDYRDSLINEKNLYHITTLEAIFESERQKDKIEELNQRYEYQRNRLVRQNILLIGGFSFFFLLLLFLFLFIRQNRLRNKYRMLKHQQRLLRSQMNPHFIFNALSAIQVYILEHDMDRSSRFLADFAKLMRQVLRNSNYDYITLSEELDMINYYIELQKLRFMPPFEFELDIDPDLDLLNMMIPPMLTQPFLENAIEHGIKPLGSGGKIILRLKKSSDRLVMEVQDNGIGIVQSEQLKCKKNKQESMAIKIVRERLEIIKKDTGRVVVFKIEDMQSNSPFTKGTIVHIALPIILKEKHSYKWDKDEKN